MSLKFSLLVSGLLTLLTEVTTHNIQPFDLWDDAELLLEDLQKTLNSASTTAQTQLSSARRRIYETRGNYSTEAGIQVEDISKKLADQLDNLNVLADVLGVPICLSGRQEELAQVTEELIDEIDQCLLHIEREATMVIVNVTIHITESQLHVDDFRSRLEGCSRDEADEDCVTVLIVEIQLARDEVPTSILDEVSIVLRLIEGWEQDLATCSDNRIGLMYTIGNMIVSEVEKCIVGDWGDDRQF